jgi:RNase P/RNase MRP subunit POP5
LRQLNKCASCRKFKQDPEEKAPAFIKGVILKSLVSIFGEVGGQFDFDILAFDSAKNKGILRVHSNYSIKLRIGELNCGSFQ